MYKKQNSLTVNKFDKRFIVKQPFIDVFNHLSKSYLKLYFIVRFLLTNCINYSAIKSFFKGE